MLQRRTDCHYVDNCMLIRSKTCTVEECAKLCLEQEGCDYFIAGNGVIDGVNKTGEWTDKMIERNVL